MGKAETRVLVVDDEEIIRHLLIEVVNREGLSACSASTGEEALVLASKNTFKVIVLDLVLPGKNGMSVAREINRISPASRFILLTGGNIPEGELRDLTGVVASLAKPFMMEEFLQALRRAGEIK